MLSSVIATISPSNNHVGFPPPIFLTVYASAYRPIDRQMCVDAGNGIILKVQGVAALATCNVLMISFNNYRPFFTLFILSRASDNTTSQDIGGTDAWAVPPPRIWVGRPPTSNLGGVPPVPLGLRLWL